MDHVIIANAWAAAADNPTSKHQIAMELVRRGHRVLWVVGAGMRSPSLGSGADRGRIVRKLRESLRAPVMTPVDGVRAEGGGLWVVAPLLIPFPRSGMVRRMNGAVFRCVAQFWGRRLGFRRPTLINYVPVLSGAMQAWRGRVVYHCVDRWDKFAMYDPDLMREADAACRRHADVVIATSRELFEHCRTDHDNVHLINHGVSHAHFAKALHSKAGAAPFATRGGPVVGFFGLLSEWVDQALILALARAMPEAEIILVGTADVDVARLAAESNIHLMGPRPFSELPSIIAHFDVCMIPFIVNDLTRAVNPIKLREMLAAGCPVVSTALPEVAAYVDTAGGAVRTGASHEEFIAAVKAFVANRPDPQRVSDLMLAETWQAKVTEMLSVMDERT